VQGVAGSNPVAPTIKSKGFSNPPTRIPGGCARRLDEARLEGIIAKKAARAFTSWDAQAPLNSEKMTVDFANEFAGTALTCRMSGQIGRSKIEQLLRL
jgi:hypothetical protein